jgi:cytochrome c oxidase assembly protein subunit 15
MTHRLVALSIVLLVASVAWRSRRECGAGSFPSKLALAWLGIICLQAVLGAATVWSNKAADIATAHVLLGALALLAGTIVSWTVLPVDSSNCLQRGRTESGASAIEAASPAT